MSRYRTVRVVWNAVRTPLSRYGEEPDQAEGDLLAGFARPGRSSARACGRAGDETSVDDARVRHKRVDGPEPGIVVEVERDDH